MNKKSVFLTVSIIISILLFSIPIITFIYSGKISLYKFSPILIIVSSYFLVLGTFNWEEDEE